MEETLALVAQRLRAWRDEAGYTLQQLASRSGVAASTIQKVETRQMVPTIAVLLKIAHGLGRRPSEFVRLNTSEAEVIHIPAAKRKRLGSNEDGWVERLIGNVTDPQLEVWRVTCPPGASLGEAAIHFEGEELLICESGSIRVQLGDENYELHPGDTLHFKAQKHHGWRNDGDNEASFLVIGTLPERMRRAAGGDDRAG